jgi:molecular chaperone HscB
MIDFTQDHFALLGLPVRYRIDEAALDAAYRALQSRVHPDRHAAGDDAQRRLALQASARVNEAFRTLKDPVERGVYLLSLRGVEAMAESDTALPPAFLMAQLERREALESARDSAALEALQVQLGREQEALTASLAAALDDRRDDAAAREAVRQLKFLAKVAADIDAAAALTD